MTWRSYDVRVKRMIKAVIACKQSARVNRKRRRGSIDIDILWSVEYL